MITMAIRRALALAATLTAAALPGCDAQSTLGGEEAAEAEAAVVEDPGAPEGTYFRLRFKHSNKCLEPLGLTAGAPLVQRACNAGAASAQDLQSFERLFPDASRPDQFMMRSPRSAAAGNALCVYISGPSLENGGGGVVYTCNTAQMQQRFIADALDAQGFSGLKAAHSGRCLSVVGGQTADGASIYQYGVNCSADNQKIKRE